MKKPLSVILILLAGAASLIESSYAQESVRLAYINAKVEVVAEIYSELSGRAVTFSPPDIAGSTITVDSGNTSLDRDRALRFIEAGLYLNGIEIKQEDEKNVVFSQFAVIEPTGATRRIIRRTE